MKIKSILLVIFAFLSSYSICAQQKESFSLQLDHMALSVKNLDNSVQFYKNVLQLQEITNKTQKEGIRWMSLGEGKELHLVSTIKDPVQINKAIHLAFKVLDFENLIKKLNQLQIKYWDWPGKKDTISIRADGVKQIYIQDPDGYWIELNSL
jgi:catechol 2,3-dioxygenase-like lactoylglutathione lyase family enzyme